MAVKFDDFIRHRTLGVVFRGGPEGPSVETPEALEYRRNGASWTIPADFRCDGCSAPEFLNDRVARFNPDYLFAYIVHDFNYGTHAMSRREADDTLLWMLRELHAPKLKRFLVWLGVRVFGWTHW